MADALEFLKKVEAEAQRLYELSDQGRWEDLEPFYKQQWINAAGKELRAQGADR